jgi:hypothetical protein
VVIIELEKMKKRREKEMKIRCDDLLKYWVTSTSFDTPSTTCPLV